MQPQTDDLIKPKYTVLLILKPEDGLRIDKRRQGKKSKGEP